MGAGEAGRGADFLPGATLARANQALTRGSHQFPTFPTNKQTNANANKQEPPLPEPTKHLPGDPINSQPQLYLFNKQTNANAHSNPRFE